jgi:hypothetical protein
VVGNEDWRMQRLCWGFFFLAIASPAEGLAAERYVAWLRDGSRVTTKSLTAWPLPGSSFRLDNRELLETDDPARFIRDTAAAIETKSPVVIMANGDCLPGTVVGLEPAIGQSGPARRVQVELDGPLVPVSGATLAVRTSAIERIVVIPQAGAPAAPGSVRLMDGRHVNARAIRWREQSLSLLTMEGIVEVDFGDLAEVVFPSVDRTTAVLADNAWAKSGQAAIGRFSTRGGAVLTAARVSREQEQGRRRGRLSAEVLYYVQPAWADEPLAIPEEEIAACGYRGADEVPLSCLEATTIANRRLIGPVEMWTANRGASGGALVVGGLESDIGIAAHAHSEIGFELPAGAVSVELAVGLESSEGGCVRCKVVNERGETLWNSGVIQGQDGLKRIEPIAVAGMKRVVLVTEFAHEERPKGADPFDIRDSVIWLSPLVKLDSSIGDPKARLKTMLAGAADWELVGDGWESTRLASEWNMLASMWYPVIILPKGQIASLSRRMTVSRTSDVVELLTVCPLDLDQHDIRLTVNGMVVPWQNNADRNQLRQWTARYSKQRARDGSAEESNLSDRLAYWWDLQAWRGQEVTVQLDLAGKRETSEIVVRSLAVRGAISNLPASGEPRRPDVPLSAAVVEGSSAALVAGGVRLLGQKFEEGYSLARNAKVRWNLKPEYKSFVAVIGCAEQVAGPVQLLVDDRVVWERAAINSLVPAEQVAIALPAGAKSLTLRSGAEAPYYGPVAVVEAGFVVK